MADTQTHPVMEYFRRVMRAYDLLPPSPESYWAENRVAYDAEIRAAAEAREAALAAMKGGDASTP